VTLADDEWMVEALSAHAGPSRQDERRVDLTARGRLLGERRDESQQRRALEEGQPSRPEVVEQGAESLGADRDLRVQLPRGVDVERRGHCVI
jgi:hypothetical protein